MSLNVNQLDQVVYVITNEDNEVYVTTIPNNIGQAAIQFQDEGANIGTPGVVNTIDFVGANVSLGLANGKLTVSLSGSSLNANLTSWGSITRASGFDTWVATPSWTNFNSLITGTAPFWSLANGGTLTGANTITGTGQTLKGVWNSLGTTQTNGYGLWLANTTAAEAGAQQISPSLVLEGQGWKTNATASSQSVKWSADVLPIQGTANPNSVLRLRSSINNAAYTDGLIISSEAGQSTNQGTTIMAGAIGAVRVTGAVDALGISWTANNVGFGLRAGGSVDVYVSGGVNSTRFNGTSTSSIVPLLLSSSHANTITANTTLDVRGISGGTVQRWANNANTPLFTLSNLGNLAPSAGTTSMTDNFIYIPAAAGVPSGVPTSITGTVPMYYDTTNNRFYIYNGAWRNVLLS